MKRRRRRKMRATTKSVDSFPFPARSKCGISILVFQKWIFLFFKQTKQQTKQTSSMNRKEMENPYVRTKFYKWMAFGTNILDLI